MVYSQQTPDKRGKDSSNPKDSRTTDSHKMPKTDVSKPSSLSNQKPRNLLEGLSLEGLSPMPPRPALGLLQRRPSAPARLETRPSAPAILQSPPTRRPPWKPIGAKMTTQETQTAFENLRKQGQLNMNRLLNTIPKGTPNTYKSGLRTESGFKYEWEDKNRQRWIVHGHDKDTGAAAADYAGAQGWTARVKNPDGKQLLGTSQKLPKTTAGQPANTTATNSNNPQNFDPNWSKGKSNNIAQQSHMPLTFAPFDHSKFNMTHRTT